MHSLRHVATANPADEKMWRTIKLVLDDAGFKVPLLRDLAISTQVKEAMLKDFLHRKSRTGEVLCVGTDRFYPRATLAQLADLAQRVAITAPDGRFTPAQYRDHCGIGRSLAMEILECFDRLGITLRLGDVRKIRKDFVPILGASTPTAAPTAVASKATTESKPQVQWAAAASTGVMRKHNV